MNAFKLMLEGYLDVTTMRQAEAWINKQPCGRDKKKYFLQQCEWALQDLDVFPRRYEQYQDYVDALRREYYD